MTAQQTAAKMDAYDRGLTDGLADGEAEGLREGERRERLRIRRALFAVGVIREGVWVYRESVIAAIKKATRAPRGRR